MDTGLPSFSFEDNFDFYFDRLGVYAYKLLNKTSQIIYQINRLIHKKGEWLPTKKTRLAALSTRFNEVASFDELKNLVNVNSNFSDLPKCCQVLILARYITLTSSLEDLTDKYLKHRVTRAGDATTTKAYKEKVELLEIEKLIQENSLREVKKLAVTPRISDRYITIANDYWARLSVSYVYNCSDRQQALIVYPDLHEKGRKLALRYWRKENIVDKKDVKILKDQDTRLNTSIIAPGFATSLTDKESKEVIDKITSIKDVQNLYKKSLKKTKESDLLLSRWKELFTQYLQEYNSLEQIVSLAGRIPPKFDQNLYFDKLESIAAQEVESSDTIENISQIISSLGKTERVRSCTHAILLKKFKELLFVDGSSKDLDAIIQLYDNLGGDRECYDFLEKMINDVKSIHNLPQGNVKDYYLRLVIRKKLESLRDTPELY